MRNKLGERKVGNHNEKEKQRHGEASAGSHYIENSAGLHIPCMHQSIAGLDLVQMWEGVRVEGTCTLPRAHKSL